MVAELVIKYQRSNRNEDFEAIHNAVSHILDRRIARDMRHTGIYDRNEIKSLHLYCLFKAAKRYPSGVPFEPYLQQSITNACISLAEKERRKRAREEPLLDFKKYDKEDTSYRHEMKKKEILNLIDSLLVGADELTRKIVRESPNHENNGDPRNLFNYTSLGRASGIIGTNPGQDVKRRLRRLARNFDSSKFGDWRNYLLG